jgi:hypothetical protein
MWFDNKHFITLCYLFNSVNVDKRCASKSIYMVPFLDKAKVASILRKNNNIISRNSKNLEPIGISVTTRSP